MSQWYFILFRLFEALFGPEFLSSKSKKLGFVAFADASLCCCFGLHVFNWNRPKIVFG
jgi:hypothetical protein